MVHSASPDETVLFAEHFAKDGSSLIMIGDSQEFCSLYFYELSCPTPHGSREY